MIIDSKTAEMNFAAAAAQKLCAAARTAPKACGIDHLDTLILTGTDKDAVAAEMRRLQAEEGWPAMFLRDAKCVEKSQAMVLIGAKMLQRGLNCTLCGFESCAACREAGAQCAFETVDLGIALGSAAASAADARVDTRILYSAGKVAVKMGLMPEYGIIMAIPISISGKSPFFDRG